MFPLSTFVYGQRPTVPQPANVETFSPTSTNKSYSTPKQNSSSKSNSQANRIKIQSNRTSNGAMDYSKPITPDNIETNKYKSPFDAQKEQSEIDKIMVELERMETIDKRISLGMPSFSTVYPETENYYSAYDELLNMTTGKTPIDIGKAVFLVENAYNDNKGSYNEFNTALNQIVQLCNDYIDHKGYDKNSNLTKNMVLFRFLSDTIVWKGTAHFPISYDFDDYMGHKDWRKMFVTKLLKTGSGQCHSMPLLYKTLAQRMGAEAYISFSPKHTYIQFKERNKFYSIELTNGMIIIEDLIFESGFIKTETIRSGIYMDTLSNQQTVAYMMQDLAQGYGMKFGSDGFVLKALNKSMEYFPNSIHGMKLKSNYYTGLFQNYMYTIKNKYKDNPNPQQLKVKYPIAYDAYLQMTAMYDLIDNTGYEPITPAQYENWLNSISQERNRQEHLKQEKQLLNIIPLRKD